MATILKTANIRSVLLDIEGTTTPIAFVHEVLFPYARSRVREYLETHFSSAETRADLAKLREEHACDLKQALQPPPLIDGQREVEINSIVAYVNWLIDRDSKSTGLKSLQGKIWIEGYHDGTLKAPLFDDVAPALKRWHQMGLKINIFSSGSSLAQKLLFAHTEAGELTPYIEGYFDTTNGPKTDIESYRRIASALGLPEDEVLFISDVVGELDAAKAAGMQTVLCLRPNNPLQAFSDHHRSVQSFNELQK
ncbi:MAG TPA: acireductone synthase [Pyrinomonadaceae bacterium]|nr:acireductone synthase [Pyrinomonadaceae bacterium]